MAEQKKVAYLVTELNGLISICRIDYDSENIIATDQVAPRWIGEKLNQSLVNALYEKDGKIGFLLKDGRITRRNLIAAFDRSRAALYCWLASELQRFDERWATSTTAILEEIWDLHDMDTEHIPE
ncbi:MAG: hypothetical protein UT41_C0001G0110 [Candidatus Wolfebacteria bacterium GW2011_GWC2_39_22]|uniref:Uncharacterized protein n=1 Tax=Candidatus Wolfebacteria bacterium GW2011_GWC2_39_22 TaxID=1619013 RepID=A0A0G0NIA7_9BACT|nr:MAG: hypothetical protein UT41_C0001G0110 [Candidatus Wolfebacteria bacterium GW2011_GWC2_39_22]HBI25767.1 hypothetical protein [Candidatus Wolfebacteria bacterium]